MNTDTTTASRNMKKFIPIATSAVLAIALAAISFLLYQSNRDLETQKATIISLQAELAKEAARAAELKSDLNSVRTSAQLLAEKSNQLETTIVSKEQALTQEKMKAESAQAALEKEKARPPALEVRIEMRNSQMKRGLVAKLSNTSSKQLTVIVTTWNPTTRQQGRFDRLIAPGTTIEIGHREGWAFASGDRLTLRSSGFEDKQYTVP